MYKHCLSFLDIQLVHFYRFNWCVSGGRIRKCLAQKHLIIRFKIIYSNSFKKCIYKCDFFAINYIFNLT